MVDHGDDLNATIDAVYELFNLGVDLTQEEMDRGLETIRDLGRQSLLNLAEDIGIRERVALYLEMIEGATTLLNWNGRGAG